MFHETLCHIMLKVSNKLQRGRKNRQVVSGQFEFNQVNQVSLIQTFKDMVILQMGAECLFPKCIWPWGPFSMEHFKGSMLWRRWWRDSHQIEPHYTKMKGLETRYVCSSRTRTQVSCFPSGPYTVHLTASMSLTSILSLVLCTELNRYE